MMTRKLIIIALFILCNIGIGRADEKTAGEKLKASDLFSNTKVAELAEALERSDLQKSAELVGNGVDVNAIGKDGITLPIWTMLNKKKDAFKWLFEHGADPNLVPENDEGVLLWACKADDPEWLSVLLDHHGNVNLEHKTEVETETPLVVAIFYHRTKNLELLIHAGANVDWAVPDSQGGGSLAIDAAMYGWPEGVYRLLEAGADWRRKTKAGGDLAYYVLERNFPPDSEQGQWQNKVIDLLKQKGADIEAARKKVKLEQAKH